MRRYAICQSATFFCLLLIGTTFGQEFSPFQPAQLGTPAPRVTAEAFQSPSGPIAPKQIPATVPPLSFNDLRTGSPASQSGSASIPPITSPQDFKAPADFSAPVDFTAPAKFELPPISQPKPKRSGTNSILVKQDNAPSGSSTMAPLPEGLTTNSSATVPALPHVPAPDLSMPFGKSSGFKTPDPAAFSESPRSDFNVRMASATQEPSNDTPALGTHPVNRTHTVQAGGFQAQGGTQLSSPPVQNFSAPASQNFSQQLGAPGPARGQGPPTNFPNQKAQGFSQNFSSPGPAQFQNNPASGAQANSSSVRRLQPIAKIPEGNSTSGQNVGASFSNPSTSRTLSPTQQPMRTAVGPYSPSNQQQQTNQQQGGQQFGRQQGGQQFGRQQSAGRQQAGNQRGQANAASSNPSRDVTSAKQILSGFDVDQAPQPLPGDPVSMRRMLETTPANNRPTMAGYYWATFSDWAEFHCCVDHINMLDQLGNGSSAVDQNLIKTAKAIAKTKLMAAEIQLAKSQSKLQRFMPNVNGNQDFSLPLPSDQPLVADYKTHFDYYSSRKAIPSEIRNIAMNLPKMQTLVSLQADTAQSAKGAVKQLRDARAGVTQQLQAMEMATDAKKQFVATVVDYNRAIAAYAFNVFGPYKSVDKLEIALVGAPKAATPQTPANSGFNNQQRQASLPTNFQSEQRGPSPDNRSNFGSQNVGQNRGQNPGQNRGQQTGQRNGERNGEQLGGNGRRQRGAPGNRGGGQGFRNPNVTQPASFQNPAVGNNTPAKSSGGFNGLPGGFVNPNSTPNPNQGTPNTGFQTRPASNGSQPGFGAGFNQGFRQ